MPNKYQILITETLQNIVIVEANNEKNALASVEDELKNSEYILSSENFTGVKFQVINKDVI